MITCRSARFAARLLPSRLIGRDPRRAGNAGDDGPATEAVFSEPLGVAIIADSGFLITDLVNYEARAVSRLARSSRERCAS
jgi:hypothetical protein